MIKFLKNYFVTSYHRPTAKILHIYVFLKSFLYNKKTTIFSEKMFLLKSPPNSMVYYNFFGRIFTLIINTITIILFNKFFSKKTFIDFNENITSSDSGSKESPWPPQSITHSEKHSLKIQDSFYELLKKNYDYSLDLSLKDNSLQDSPWWKLCRDEYKDEFIDEQDKIKVSSLENFRHESKMQSAILSDFFLKKNHSRINKLKSLSLINLYHKLSEYVNLDILRSASDSYVGNNVCLNYRDQRLSHTILRHAYFCSQIINNTRLNMDKRNIILDLGGGYGSLTRLLKHYYRKSTFIIFEVPEACFIASYFLKKNFPDSKIGLPLEFENKDSIGISDLEKYDFIILPQPFLNRFKSDVVDLFINTISLCEMTNETQNFYLENIERVTKEYFYSVNRPEKRVEKYNTQGFYNWKFKKNWRSLVYNYTHTYHIEFLGKKLP